MIKKEPAATFGVLAAAIIAALSIFGVVVDLNTIETILVAVVPLISGLLTRQGVVPLGKISKDI